MAGRNPSPHTRVKRKLVSLRWVTFMVWVILIMLVLLLYMVRIIINLKIPNTN